MNVSCGFREGFVQVVGALSSMHIELFVSILLAFCERFKLKARGGRAESAEKFDHKVVRQGG